jgi:hypothetical protein
VQYHEWQECQRLLAEKREQRREQLLGRQRQLQWISDRRGADHSYCECECECECEPPTKLLRLRRVWVEQLQ